MLVKHKLVSEEEAILKYGAVVDLTGYIYAIQNGVLDEYMVAYDLTNDIGILDIKEIHEMLQGDLTLLGESTKVWLLNESSVACKVKSNDSEFPFENRMKVRVPNNKAHTSCVSFLSVEPTLWNITSSSVIVLCDEPSDVKQKIYLDMVFTTDASFSHSVTLTADMWNEELLNTYACGVAITAKEEYANFNHKLYKSVDPLRKVTHTMRSDANLLNRVSQINPERLGELLEHSYVLPVLLNDIVQVTEDTYLAGEVTEDFYMASYDDDYNYMIKGNEEYLLDITLKDKERLDDARSTLGIGLLVNNFEEENLKLYY